MVSRAIAMRARMVGVSICAKTNKNAELVLLLHYARHAGKKCIEQKFSHEVNQCCPCKEALVPTAMLAWVLKCVHKVT